jgi:hypothetical protein
MLALFTQIQFDDLQVFLDFIKAYTFASIITTLIVIKFKLFNFELSKKSMSWATWNFYILEFLCPVY